MISEKLTGAWQVDPELMFVLSVLTMILLLCDSENPVAALLADLLMLVSYYVYVMSKTNFLVFG